MDTNEDKKITISQAAIILNVHPNTIRNYIRKGNLTQYALPSGMKIYLCEAEVRALIQKKETLYG